MAAYQVPVSYDGNKIIPVSRMSIERSIERSPDGTSRQRGWRITISGEVVAFAGSPRNDGTFWTASGYPPDETPSTNAAELRIRNLRNKLKALVDLFKTDGKWFEVQPGDGSAPIKAQIRASRVLYNEGQWFNTVPFSIEMETSKLFFGNVDMDYDFGTFQKDNVPEETWSLEQSDEVGRTYRLTHSVNANGKKLYNDDGTILAEGWQVARAYILGPSDPDFSDIAGTDAVNFLGIDSSFLIGAGVLDLTTFQPYNYIRGNQVDKAGGRYSVNETWLCYNPDQPTPTGKQAFGKALEEFTVETRYATDTGINTITVSGQIIGLEERNNTDRTLISTKIDNAEARLAQVYQISTLLTLAQTYTGITLNPIPLTATLTKNLISGVYQYSMSFDTRVGITAGFLSEIYTATLDNAADVFAEIGVVGRPAGPILQPIGSTTKKAITMTAEIVVQVSYGQPLPSSPIYNPLPAVLGIIGVPAQIFVAADQVNWTPRLGRYSRRTTYVYQ